MDEHNQRQVYCDAKRQFVNEQIMPGGEELKI